ncbi:segregation and condensation protein A [Halanaeroarchaeum sulfurireducens]|uniref:Chromosome segregation and condensation protein ScpA n=1 Tax=Halanaeroarchaeum sulfurireducens TaxID=1604004 RepID=A0A0N9MUF1_9EURY|nr:ScpA family protein [Halanaeroarchaeum sulfurireducens]ALG81544.1 chromosome segregation and condensation protein ScpA [Halanaeroarchaeum sulfurireducens]
MTDGVDVARPPDPDPTEEENGDVEPVELLVQLAKQGDIDPWDVDIVTVTDEFLAALDDGDLRTSGRALFYASVLLRMKSDVMLSDDSAAETDDEPMEPKPPWEEGWGDQAEDAPAGDPIAALESEMERRLERKTARGTPMTLDELVRDLRSAERDSWWKESRTYDTSESPSGFDRGVQTLDYRSGDDMRAEGEPDADAVTGATHQEDIDALIESLWAELELAYSRGRTEVLFAEVEDAAGSRVESFLALLFLSHRGRVVQEQDELFGDLWIVDPDSSPEETDDEPQ